MPNELPRDGLVAVVKHDCPTCVLTAPVLGELAREGGVTVYTQDDAAFPDTVPERSTTRRSTYPTGCRSRSCRRLIRFEGGREVGPHLWLGSRRMGAAQRCPRARPRSARSTARLRRQKRRAWGARTPEDPVQRDRAQIAPRRDRRRTRTSRRRCTSAAGRTGCRWCRRPRSACCGCSTGRAAIRRRSRPRPARYRAGDGREDCGQCGDGRLQAGISAGRAGRRRGGARREFRDARGARDDRLCRAGPRRQRPRSGGASG